MFQRTAGIRTEPRQFLPNTLGLLKTFLGLLGESRFIERIKTAPGTFVFLFETDNKKKIALAYAHPHDQPLEPWFTFDHILDASGTRQEHGQDPLVLTGRPIYLMDVA